MTVDNPVTPFETRRAAALDTSPPEARWLIESLWADSGVGVIGGTPKSYKSWLGLEIACAVASGTRCLGHFEVPRAGPTLVYLAEDDLGEVRIRLEHLARSKGLLLDQLDVHVICAPTVRLDIERDLKRLAKTVAQIQPRFLLLDPFVRLHHLDENNASDISHILGHLRTIQRHYDTAVCVVHHTRKQSSSGQRGQALRGSGDLHAWGDSNLYLTWTKKGLELSVEHRSAPCPDPLYVELDCGTHPHLTLVEPDDNEPPALTERVLGELRSLDGPITRTRLREKLAVQNKRLGDALKELERLGRIQRTTDGWQI